MAAGKKAKIEVEVQEENNQEDKITELIEKSVHTAGELKDKAPEIKGIPTGVEGLDNLFFVSQVDSKGKVKTRPLGGYPLGAVVHLAGIPDTGKSLMAEQFAVKQASLGYPVCYVTVEQPAPFLVSSLRQRARAMGVDFDDIEDKIILIDAASNSTFREDLSALKNALAYAIKNYGAKSTVIDSVTGLYEAREMMARQIVRNLFNFMKAWHQTAIFISQKRSGHEELTAEAAGGYAVSHVVDCSIVLAKKEIMSRYDQSTYGKPIGEMVRLFRIDGCRLCGHDTRVHLLEITEKGLVKVGPTLQELLASKKK